VTFSISVLDRNHLARIMRRIRANQVVIRIYRKKSGET
jgi:guanosine-3',5'-bis(diphosphate) 3'-pyrophosphohydrolase